MSRSNRTGIIGDLFTISHKVSLYTREILSLEFEVFSYGMGAAHPRHRTQTLNFRLRPSLQLEITDIFKRSSNYLQVLSGMCSDDLFRQKSKRYSDSKESADLRSNDLDDWILSQIRGGADPEISNLEHLSLKQYGVVIHFDEYQVGCYAEGKYEVSIPLFRVESVMVEEFADLLR